MECALGLMSANTFFIVNDLTLNYFMLKTQKYNIYLNAQNKSNIFKRFQMFKSCNLKKFGKIWILVKYEYNNFKIAKALNCLNKMEAKSKSTWENIAFGCFNNLFHLYTYKKLEKFTTVMLFLSSEQKFRFKMWPGLEHHFFLNLPS